MSHLAMLLEAFLASSLALTEKQAQQLDIYLDMLLDWNKRMNLTAITDPLAVIQKHFIDCAMLLPDLPEKREDRPLMLMDVGSGAGFPGFVIAILRSDIEVTCLDSLQKRIGFLQALRDATELSNISALLHGRAEDFGHMTAHREQYDVVTSRAVAAMPKLLEYTLPFATIGGSVIAMKGADADAEVLQGAHAAEVLGADAAKIRHFHLPEGDERANITYHKLSATEGLYPRRAKAIDRKPL